MKENSKIKNLLDLKKIDIAVLRDNEKGRIYGGAVTYDGHTCYFHCGHTYDATCTCASECLAVTCGCPVSEVTYLGCTTCG